MLQPNTPGWTSAATAIHSIRDLPGSMLLALQAPGYRTIVIDFRHDAFDWDLPLDDFPPAPTEVTVQTQAVQADDPAMFALPGRNLDALLWMIGLHSFDGEPAWWLPTDHQYRLTRWPNLTELAHSPEQMRMIAMLGNGAFGADELASGAGVSTAEAQRLLNALSLMGILREVAATPSVAPEAPATTGFFRRLFERLSARG